MSDGYNVQVRFDGGPLDGKVRVVRWPLPGHYQYIDQDEYAEIPDWPKTLDESVGIVRHVYTLVKRYPPLDEELSGPGREFGYRYEQPK